MAIVKVRVVEDLNNPQKSPPKNAIRIKKIDLSHFTVILISFSVLPLNFGEETLILF